MSYSDNLARAFYNWIQVRNMGAVEKGDEDRAKHHHNKTIQLKVIRAWYYSREVSDHMLGYYYIPCREPIN